MIIAETITMNFLSVYLTGDVDGIGIIIEMIMSYANLTEDEDMAASSLQNDDNEDLPLPLEASLNRNTQFHFKSVDTITTGIIQMLLMVLSRIYFFGMHTNTQLQFRKSINSII